MNIEEGKEEEARGEASEDETSAAASSTQPFSVYKFFS